MQVYDRINIDVTNTALEPDKYSVKRAAEDFRRFRSAKAGAILKGVDHETYEKVANLRVDGHPAVKVLYDNGRGQDTSSSPAAGAPLPRVHETCVYVEKDGEVWKIVSYAFFDKETLKKSPLRKVWTYRLFPSKTLTR